MKQKFILFGFLLLACNALFAQVYKYNFNNNLTEAGGLGPTLTEVLDCGATAGSYSSQTITTAGGPCGTGAKTVFDFNAGGGLSFSNAASLIGGNYTINILFKFDVVPGGIGGYQRILDFSNGANDDGLYANGNCLTIGNQEFTPGANYVLVAPSCPVLTAGTYILITVVRDGGTGDVKVYTDGNLYATFTDVASTYLPATATTPIVIFRDNTAGCEAGDGSVKYFALSTTADNATAVSNTFTSLCSSTLPLRMVDFTANVQNSNSVFLKWATEAEENTSRFELERSAPGGSFSKVATIATNNTQSRNDYNFTDRQPLAGTNLYRIKIIDINGEVKYSNILKVNLSGKGNFEIYPNPAKDVVTINGIKANQVVKLVNAEGRELVQKISTGQSITLDVSKYPAGMYLVLYFDGEKMQQQKIMKQ